MPITGTGEAAAVDPVASLVTALTTAAGNYASPQGAWSSSTTYTLNQVVTYGGGTYRAKTASTNVTPGTDATNWESWGGGAFTNQGGWVTSTAYVVGDVVTQSSQRYACRTAHTSGTFATDLAASKWVALTPGVALAAVSNLSDVVSVSSARTNLGAGAASGLATLDSSTLVPTAQLGTGSADSTKLLAGDRTWATAVSLAQPGQTPSQAPVTAASAASVGSQSYAARSDHVHPDTHPYALPMDSGKWWRLSFVTVAASWAGLPGGTVGFLRFPIGASCSIAAMGIQVTTLQANGLARLGIYSDNAGAPGTLLKDYGTVATDATGYKTTGATTALALSPGWVWLAVGMEGTFGAQQFDTLSAAYSYTGAATLGGNACGYNGSGYAGGGLPGTASTLTSFNPSIRVFFPWVQTA